MSIHKPASRITLEDLFGSSDPTQSEIDAVASATRADQKRTAERERAAWREALERDRDPSKQDRLAAIKRAADATASMPDWTRHWHPVARTLVQERAFCHGCDAEYLYPAAPGYMIKWLNSRSDATQILPPSGPIDQRLPLEIFEHTCTVEVCYQCATQGEQSEPAGSHGIPSLPSEAIFPSAPLPATQSTEGTQE